MPPRPEIERVLKDVGRRIAAARHEADLTQETAASKAGIDVKRWQRIEAGEVNATIRTLVRVSAALGTTLWDLLVPKPPAVRRRRRASS